MLSSILFQVLLAGAAAAVPIIEQREAACTPIHIIAARGSTEAPGPGAIGSLATLIQAANPGTDLESITYPALLGKIEWRPRKIVGSMLTRTNVVPYDFSSSAGTAAVSSQLTAYVRRCPSSKVVLLGYSQGAHILLDSLCGGGGYPGLGPATQPLPTAIGDHVTAVVQYGDPRFLFGQPYDAGTNKRTNGVCPGSTTFHQAINMQSHITNTSSLYPQIFPRRLPAQSCARYASKIRSWCDVGDPFCASGFDLAAHLDYDQEYDQAALAFVNQKLAA
ncbi:MAG: hypothetical protein Q9187_004433 [Circinaria calcarea]